MESLAGMDALLGKPFKVRDYPMARRSRREWSALTLGLVITDIVMVTLAFAISYLIRFESSLSFFALDVDSSLFFYMRVVAILIPIWVAIFSLFGLYNRQNLVSGTKEYSLVFRACANGFLFITISGFLQPDLILARGWVLLAWLFTFCFTMVGRFTIRRIIGYMRTRGYFLASALIIGTNEEAFSLAAQLSDWEFSGLHLLGFIEDETADYESNYDLPVVGGLNELEDIVAEFGIEEIIIATSAISRDHRLTIFKEFGVSDKVRVRLSSGLYELITTGLEVKEVASVPLIMVNKVRLTGMDEFLKLILDYTITIPGLLVILPIMGIISLLIKMDSPGEAIHHRRVMGVNGRQFNAFKFRTMYVNGDEILEQHPHLKAELALNHKLKDDPRITKIGQFLRKTSLDELPQLFNVLKRDMSLVGPRMIAPAELEKYSQWNINLLTVRPGITGLWQVSGRSDLNYEARVNLDMYYVRNWTLWLDLRILIQTPLAVFKGRGAY